MQVGESICIPQLIRQLVAIVVHYEAAMKQVNGAPASLGPLFDLEATGRRFLTGCEGQNRIACSDSAQNGSGGPLAEKLHLLGLHTCPAN